MTRDEKIESIKNISKEEQVHEVLMDLLEGMNYRDITLTHERGSLPENGKDIVASKFDEIENKKEWTAFVIKKGDVRGTSQGVQEIVSQVEDCFTYSWNSIVKGKDIRISKVKVVTNGKFNSGAEQKILQNNQFNNPNISFWSCNELVSHIDNYCDRIWLKGNKDYKKYIEIFQKRNREDDITKAVGLADKKIKKIIDFAIHPKLDEVNINDSGELRKRVFDLHSVATLNENALIVGEAGSGKSTFFKLLSKDIIEQNFIRDDYEFYPFIINFNDLKNSSFSIADTIKQHLKSDEYKSIEIDFESILKSQNFVLFIDALDELGNIENKERALESVQNFKSLYSKVRIYCSSRPADSLMESCQKIKFKYLEINNVTMQQAEQFMSRYFNEDQIKCDRLLKSLKDSNILDKMPKTPLTLALVAAIFDENQYEIPATISDLYSYFIDTLLNKQIKNSTIDLLNVGVHKSVLSFLAEHLHTSRIKRIERSKLKELITEFAQERGHKYDIDELISEFVGGIGMLIENDRKEIEFKHLSFQEYLTAYQFYNHTINGKNNFIENFNDIWWQNVAIFFAGMTKDSPQLINEILEKSVPKDFKEYLINLSGLGHLMQALYNTPISARILGIRRNLLNAKNAIESITNTGQDQYELIKRIWNTEFGLLKIVGHWYGFHHNSITLKEPLEIVFNDLIDIIKNPESSKEDRKFSEYYGYMIAETLYFIGDEEFLHMEKLYSVIDMKNYHVVSLIDSSFFNEYGKMSKEVKTRKSIKKLKSKLDLMNRSIVSDKVNRRLIDGSKVVQFSKRPNSNIKFSRRKKKG
jgi:energy-coupling factor transporter ATP-binding protein EcfA2